MARKKSSAEGFLQAAYDGLQYNEGDLLSASTRPNDLTAQQWIDKGEWLSLAQQVGAERVFFVKNNPVIVFARSEVNDELHALQLFNRIWCMSRPMLLFIARHGGLFVYSLARPPVKTLQEWRSRPLDVVQTIAEVATKLHDFRRAQVESGRLFEDARFESTDERADKLLIQDLKAVRASLMRAGLDSGRLKYAHALIGRSIFIRYLEDREILSEEYFRRVAANNRSWELILDKPLSTPFADPAGRVSLYTRVLSDRDFTYALFKRLAYDFNGDMFPSDEQEERAVKQKHCSRLQNFLVGNVGSQLKLFLWAYRFEIVPVELISSIYEEFYHEQTTNSDIEARAGTHYTPSSLVEYVLSQVLTQDRLESSPRVLDPACGSGIFLVEAFRRIVRFRVRKREGARLDAKELREILRTQIAGIEINEEAVRIAAFSLYLALLHYQEPRDIIKQIEQKLRLPNLIYQDGKVADEFRYNILRKENTFNVIVDSTEPTESPWLVDETGRTLGGKVDVVVGNPPWGTADESDVAMKWCAARNLPVGDHELSQAFIWKTLEFLRDGGSAGLLVSTGVFFKHHSKSIEFRKRWLRSIRLSEVVNFAHVREIFFSAGIAPFALVIFEKPTQGSLPQSSAVQYWSAKNTAQTDRLQAAVLDRNDLRVVSQEDLMRDDKLWKIYWWGNTRDRALINWLELNTPLGELEDQEGKRLVSGQGFKKTGTKIITVQGSRQRVRDMVPSLWLTDYPTLPTEYLHRYGPIDSVKFAKVPAKVHRRGVKEVYEGSRLLIKRGISQSTKPKGQIVARLESEAFSFRNSVHGIKLRGARTEEYKVLLGIFWSSLARYYYFLTSSGWGMWHYELHLEEIERMPTRFPDDNALLKRIVKTVDRLRTKKENLHPEPGEKNARHSLNDLAALEEQLDEAIFDLYELSEPERDQVRDMCDVGIEFFYNKHNSEAVKPVSGFRPTSELVLFPDLFHSVQEPDGVEDYVSVFLSIWNNELKGTDARYTWSNMAPGYDWPLIALVFSVVGPDAPFASHGNLEQNKWQLALEQLGASFIVPYITKHMFTDGIVRAVTDTDIVIIKRNEKRLWTRSMAREDAEAVMVQAINMQDKGQNL